MCNFMIEKVSNGYMLRCPECKKKGQLELLEKWNELGFNFEPNYQVKTDMDLFYVDGYDNKYHTSFGQRKKDLVKHKKIIDVLHPKKFWRFDSVNKQFRNILGE